MAFDFPNAPAVGTTFLGTYQYVWDGEKWTMGEGAPPPTADTTPPILIALSPLDNAIDVPVGVNLVVTFSEPVMFGTGNFNLKRTSDDTTIEAFNVATEVGTGPGQISILGPAVTMNTTADMTAGTGFYVLIDATAIDDLAGNSFAGIPSKTVWNWTTAVAPDTTAPILSALTGDATSATTASYVVTTDEANGNIYWVVSLTAVPTPTPTQILFGQDGSGAPALDSGNQAVTATGAQAAFTPDGLTASTVYDVHVMHRDAASNNSTVLSDEFTTTALVYGAPTLSIHPDSDTGTLGDNVTSDTTPNFNWAHAAGVTPVENGRIYMKKDNVVMAAMDGGLGYHILSAAEAAGSTPYNPLNMGTLVVGTTYLFSGKYTGPGGTPDGTYSANLSVQIAAGLDADVQAIIDAFEVTPNAAYQAAIAQLVTDLKTGPINGTNNWTTLRWWEVPQSQDVQSALLNWRYPTESATRIGNSTFVNTHVPNFGFEGNLTQSCQIETGLAYSAASPYTLNSAAIGIFMYGAPGGYENLFGTSTGAGGSSRTLIGYYDVENATYTALNSVGGFDTDIGDGLGLLSLVRNSADNFELWKNATLISTKPETSTTLPTSGTIRFMGTEGGTTNGDASLFYFGAGRSATQMADLHAAFNTYRTTVGAF